ncbi:hypothetical protein K435DRAFT_668206 [Dendrothele bispora CBS 962.96]|uniref:PARP catalytic domain-containing protein n=1 Tax=Dendrothele bispora (strain CBS 962.96) TaxID=1314807 RepID=A0A4S8LY20_DENBC|nr:hypothetical protein K435DRAFT_668206 [Dendrothele bispora CBS 962.96]
MAAFVKNVVHWGAHQRSQMLSNDLCETCGKKPKFVENGFKHPYCSRTCARSGPGPGPKPCLLRGCRVTGRPAFADFCSDIHAKEGVRKGQVQGCTVCGTQPRSIGELCITCERSNAGKTRFRELDNNGATFKQVRSQFISEWDSHQKPSVEKVYEVILPRDVQNCHASHRKRLQSAKELRTFHAAQCICNLGVSQAVLCDFKSCGICTVVKSSFKTFAFGEPTNNGRFGEGIYSYRNPQLADKFATSCTSSPYRVMIACDIVVENMVEVPEDESLFVATADAIIPAYVIMYK